MLADRFPDREPSLPIDVSRMRKCHTNRLHALFPRLGNVTSILHCNCAGTVEPFARQRPLSSLGRASYRTSQADRLQCIQERTARDTTIFSIDIDLRASTCLVCQGSRMR